MDTALKIRKHLTPPRGMRALGSRLGAPEDMRREIRREVSERVTLRSGGRAFDGWTLNISRGGVRVIVEQEAALGDEVDVTVGTISPIDATEDSPVASHLTRRGRIVWLQEEADGYILGVAFLGLHSSQQ